jgi:hypothetical protein
MSLAQLLLCLGKGVGPQAARVCDSHELTRIFGTRGYHSVGFPSLEELSAVLPIPILTVPAFGTQ